MLGFMYHCIRSLPETRVINFKLKADLLFRGIMPMLTKTRDLVHLEPCLHIVNSISHTFGHVSPNEMGI